MGARQAQGQAVYTQEPIYTDMLLNGWFPAQQPDGPLALTAEPHPRKPAKPRRRSVPAVSSDQVRAKELPS